MPSSLKEDLADIQHQIWSHWMRYMLDSGRENEDGTWTMPADKLDRWTRWMITDYDDLTEKEKESDRHQADKVLDVMIGFLHTQK